MDERSFLCALISLSSSYTHRLILPLTFEDMFLRGDANTCSQGILALIGVEALEKAWTNSSLLVGKDFH